MSEYWANLLSGQSGAAPITHFDASNFKTRFACEVKNFNVTDYIDRKEARKQDPYTQYAVVATAEAMQDSNIDLDTIDLDRARVIWGSELEVLKLSMMKSLLLLKGMELQDLTPSLSLK